MEPTIEVAVLLGVARLLHLGDQGLQLFNRLRRVMGRRFDDGVRFELRTRRYDLDDAVEAQVRHCGATVALEMHQPIVL